MKKYYAIIVFFIVGLVVGAPLLALAPESANEKPEMVETPIEPEYKETKTVSDIEENGPEFEPEMYLRAQFMEKIRDIE